MITPSKKGGNKPTAQPTTSNKKAPANDDLDTRPTKRMKTDHKAATTTPSKEEDVEKLFTAPKAAPTTTTVAPAKTAESNGGIDMTQKKYLYKLISDNKGADLKTSVDRLWKAYMTAPESETFKRGKAIISSKAHLVQIVEELEKDNLVMYSSDDGNVILI